MSWQRIQREGGGEGEGDAGLYLFARRINFFSPSLSSPSFSVSDTHRGKETAAKGKRKMATRARRDCVTATRIKTAGTNSRGRWKKFQPLSHLLSFLSSR